MASILVTGGTGFIGQKLCGVLEKNGHQISILSRSKSTNPKVFNWDIENDYIDPNALKNIDYIIHLAGENISKKRWTKKQRTIILESRVKSTLLLHEKVQEFNPELKGFIAASGVGFYGAITDSSIFTENDQPGNDFLSKVCQQWELASLKFTNLNIRTVIFRTAVVFSKEGGALAKLVKPIKLGFGAVLGTGNQFIPWIHMEDLCRLYLKAIENQNLYGIYNAVAPEHITNKQLTLRIAKKLGKKIILPNIPKNILQLIVGKMAEILLEGSRVSSKNILKSGFEFKYSKF